MVRHRSGIELMLPMDRFRELLRPDCQPDEQELQELRRQGIECHMLADVIDGPFGTSPA